MSNQTNERRAIALGLLAVGMWSTVATAFKIALSTLDVLQLLFIANLASVIVLSVLLGCQPALRPKGSWCQHWGKSAVLGLLNPVAYYCVLLAAYDRLPAQIAQPINYTWALVLSFFAAWRFGHKLTKNDWIASALGYGGVVVLVIPSTDTDTHISWLGIVLAISSTFIWASYWLFNQGDQRPAMVSLWQAFVCALPINAILMMLFSHFPDLNLYAWLAGTYVGAFEMGFAFAAWLMALKQTQHTARISNLIFLSPLISLGLIHWVLDEPIYPSTPIGLALILLGLFIQQKKSTKTHTNKIQSAKEA
jgi:drug/metabolite transporter (DMT)-like permease